MVPSYSTHQIPHGLLFPFVSDLSIPSSRVIPIYRQPTHLILQLPHDHFVCSLILGLLNHHLGVLQQSLRPLQVLFQLGNLLLVPAAVKQVLKSGASIRKDVP